VTSRAPALEFPLERRAESYPYRATAQLVGEKLAIASVAVAIAMLPFLIPPGPHQLAPVDAVIALAIFSSLLWLGTAVVPVRAPYALAVGVMVVAGAAGALAGPVPVSGLVAVIQDMWLLAWCICIANVCRAPRSLALVLRTWTYSAIGWGALLLVGELTNNTHLTGVRATEGGRTSLLFRDPNVSAHYFFLSIMIMAATRRPRSRVVRFPAYALLLVGMALSGSNSGIVELVLASALIAVIGIYQRSGAVPAIAMACCLLTVGAAAIPRVPISHIQHAAHDSRYRIFRDWVGRSNKTAGQRETLARESVDLYYRGGPFGEGPTSTIARLKARQAPFAKEAHNDYLAALVERGALGAVGIMLLVVSVCGRVWAVARRPLSAGFAEVVPFTAPLVAAVAGTLVLGTVYEALHVRQVWALMAVVAALYCWGRQRDG
jgi:O-Antigen ligase